MDGNRNIFEVSFHANSANDEINPPKSFDFRDHSVPRAALKAQNIAALPFSPPAMYSSTPPQQQPLPLPMQLQMQMPLPQSYQLQQAPSNCVLPPHLIPNALHSYNGGMVPYPMQTNGQYQNVITGSSVGGFNTGAAGSGRFATLTNAWALDPTLGRRKQQSQERNRIAAIRSRQRKKQEWERLVQAESDLRRENIELKQQLARIQQEFLHYQQEHSPQQ